MSTAAQIPTPSIVIDAAVARRNLQRLADYAAQNKVKLRPHTKTHKSAMIGKMQMDLGATGLTVAKVGEARVMAEVCGDLLMAYPAVDPLRCAELAQLAGRVTMRVGIDSTTAADAMSSAARAAGTTIGILVDLDVGLRRTGVQSSAEAMALAQHVSKLAGLRLDGLMFYPGHVKDESDGSLRELGAVEAKLAETVALFRRSGLSTSIVSGGSTPAAYHAHRMPSMTEARPGTYVFHDMTGVHGGYAKLEDCAARVQCTVVSTAVPGHFVIDAGSKTLTSDRCGPAPESGHGYVVEYPQAKIVRLNEEHGVVDVSGCESRPKVGERVTVIPNHICPCINLQDQVWWNEGTDAAPIPVDARGKVFEADDCMTRRIFDSHLDLAWSAVFYNRDLTQPLETIRAREAGMTDVRGRGNNVLCLPELRRAGVGVCVATLLARSGPAQTPHAAYARTDLDYAAPSLAHAAAHAQLAYYRWLEQEGQVRLLRTARELEEHWAAYAAAPQTTPLGIILSMEGTDPITTPDEAREWYAAGLRAAGLAHYGRGQHAYGTGVEGPLSSAGIELLRVMDDIGMILDVTHLCDLSMKQALDYFEGPVLASHHNCRALVPGDRQLADEQIKQIVGRGGVIGVALDAWMLYPGWVRGQTQPEVVGLAALADHIDRICEAAGDRGHVALGTDLDGGFGNEQTPRELRVYGDLQLLGGILADRGYVDGEIDGIFHRNWLEFFGRALPA